LRSNLLQFRLLDQQGVLAAPAEIAGERQPDRPTTDDEDGAGAHGAVVHDGLI